MMKSTPSRRTFGKAAIAGAALLGPAAFLLRGQVRGNASPDNISIVPGQDVPGPLRIATPMADEVAQWTSLIGQSIAVSAAEGTVVGILSAVTELQSTGNRPPQMRQVPFAVSFTFPLNGAPRGNAIYRIGQSVAGLSELFMTRCEDRNGSAMLLAIIA